MQEQLDGRRFTNAMKLKLLAFFFLVCFYSKAQNPILEEQIAELSASADSLTKAKIDNFSKLLTNLNQAPVESLFTTLVQKKYPKKSILELISAIEAAKNRKNASPKQLENLVTFLNKELNNNGKGQTIITTLENYFSKDILYTYNYNSLYAIGGQLDFDFFENPAPYYNSESQTNTPTSTFDNWDEDDWDNPNLEQKSNSIASLPSVNGLLLKLKGVTLVIKSPTDSLKITNTEGALALNSSIFTGKAGSTTWKNVGLADAKATFDTYSLIIENPYLKAEDVSLVYPTYFTQPIKGVFEFKGQNREKGIEATFPRFKSYQSEAAFKLNDFSNYKGGFSLIGARRFSSAVDNNRASIHVNKESYQEYKFRTLSNKFEFLDSTVISSNVEFAGYFETDSISHPYIKLNYDLNNHIVKLNKVDKGGFKNAYFSDTYHQVDINCDAMYWALDSAKIDFYIVSGKSELPAVFESFNYFNENRLRYLSTNAGYNPLITAGNIVFKKKKNVFSQDEIAAIIKKDPSIIKNGLTISRQMGFFDYNQEYDLYRLSRKGLHYFKSFRGLSDYDDLVVTSVAKAGNKNARIDLNTKSFDLEGAQNFKLSDSLGVKFFPKDSEMKMVGNKEFEFKGEITVKNYRFVGDFKVEYENLTVQLNRIDSILFTPIALYRKGLKKEIGGNVRYLGNGVLQLNDPNNKSGRKKLVEYPKLTINTGTKATFNDSTRVAKFSDAFFFEGEAFKLDSLNEVDLVLQGKVNGSSIFNTINTSLQVMPDSSFGFAYKATSPLKIYDEESQIQLEKVLALNNSGLTSSGTLNHLAAEIKADSVFFSEDSLMAYGKSGLINKEFQKNDVFFPEMQIKDFTAKWRPSADSLAIEATEGYSFFNNSTKLTGAVVVKSSGLFGAGTLDRPEASTVSKDIKFENTSYTSKNSRFEIKGDTKPLMVGQNVDIVFDVTQNQATISPLAVDGFSTNDTLSSSIAFPFASYKTTIDKAVWQVANKKVVMQGDVETSSFTSTNPDQYGLTFKATGAEYDLTTNLLNVTGVPEVRSVDAAIIPANGLVSIKKEGILEPFLNAKIVVDTLNRYHTLANANITVKSKKEYSGTADYQFVSVSKDTFNLKLSTFDFAQLNAKGQIVEDKKNGGFSTIASANITEKDQLFLSPKMLYQGSIQMKAPIETLDFEGSIKPDLPNYPYLGGFWVNYSGNKTDQISIDVGQDLKDGGKPLYVGLGFSVMAEANALYPTFLSDKKYEDDLEVFSAKGVLKRDQENNRFFVSSPTSPSTFSFYDDQGLMEMEGKLNFVQPELAGAISTYGKAHLNLDSSNYYFSTLLKYDFDIPRPLVEKLGSNIVKANLDAGHADPAFDKISEDFVLKIKNFLGEKAIIEYQTRAETKHLPLPEFAPQTLAPFLFTDLNLSYNQAQNSFYSIGSLGISNIGSVDINAKVPGYFEIKKYTNSEDEISLFLDISPGYWYYFGYKNGELGIASSDLDIVNAIDSKSKSKDFAVIKVETSEAQLFKKRFLITYLGISPEELKKEPAKTQVNTPVVSPQNPAKPATPKKKDDELNGF